MSLTQYLKPDRVNRETVSEDTPLPVAVVSGGGGGGSLSAEATAAAPTYTEGQNAPLSMDLSGGLRVTGSFSASTAGTATAAAPTYVEGATNAPLSFNLAGDQRVIAKQSGTWNIGSITTLPALAAGSNTIGSISNISGTISLPTGAATAANQTSVIGTKAAGTAAASSILTGGVFNTALPTLTNGQQAALQFDSSARLYVNVGTSALPTGAATAANQATANTALGAPSDAAWASGDGSHTALLKTIATKSLDTAPVAVALGQSDYEVVEASQTDQMLGSTGAIGDVLESLLVIPTSTTVGAVSIEDGSTNTVVYAGGTVGADLKPFPIPLFGIASVNGGWEVTTGVGARVIAFGRFT